MKQNDFPPGWDAERVRRILAHHDEQTEAGAVAEDEAFASSIKPPEAVGHALDRFIGTWSAEQEAKVLKAVEVFEQVDESFWQQ